jgi:hypothetical protein
MNSRKVIILNAILAVGYVGIALSYFFPRPPASPDSIVEIPDVVRLVAPYKMLNYGTIMDGGSQTFIIKDGNGRIAQFNYVLDQATGTHPKVCLYKPGASGYGMDCSKQKPAIDRIIYHTGAAHSRWGGEITSFIIAPTYWQRIFWKVSGWLDQAGIK